MTIWNQRDDHLAMQVRHFRILSLSFASEVIRDGFSLSWLVTSLHCDRTCSRYL